MVKKSDRVYENYKVCLRNAWLFEEAADKVVLFKSGMGLLTKIDSKYNFRPHIAYKLMVIVSLIYHH